MLIHASEVAACIGRNPYKARADMLRVVLRRYDVAAFEDSGLEIQEEEDALVVLAARAADPAIDLAVRNAEASGSKTNVAEVHHLVKAGQEAAADSVVGFLTPGMRAVVERHCRDEAFRQFGTAKETESMRGLEMTVGTLVKDDKYTKRRVDGPIKVFVGGRVDGFATPPATIPLSSGSLVTPQVRPTVLVEIKNRMNRLFRRVVDYERIQVLTYMHIFQRRCAKLIERMGEEVAVHDIPYDHDEWLEISAALQDFAKDVIALTHSGLES